MEESALERIRARATLRAGYALDADDLLTAVNEWVVFATSEGKIDRARDYWVLGKGAETTGPRWSILRDVLGWVD